VITKEKFEQLTGRIEGTRLKATFSEDDGIVEITVPAGREERVANLRDVDQLDALLSNPINSIFCVGPYAAVSCYTDGWVESAIEFGAPFMGPSQMWYRTFFGRNIYDGKEPIPIELSSASMTITIQPASDTLRAYLPFFDLVRLGSSSRGDQRPLPAIRIEAEPFSTNESATDLLERISSSLFFQIDLLKGMPFALRRVRERRRFSSGRRAEGELADILEFPKHEYDSEALAYFWAARAARHSPHFQYLSFYQVIEYYFRTFAKRASADRVRNLLQDPTFRSDRHSDVTKLIDACETGETLGEREQLRLTLSACVAEQEVRDWLEENDERKDFLTTKKGKSVSDLLLPLRDTGGGFLTACAQRIYDIRCKIVHSGATSKEEGEGNILPLSHYETTLYADIDLVEFFAVKVIVANAASLQTKQG